MTGEDTLEGDIGGILVAQLIADIHAITNAFTSK